jgi:hypothetical protein
VGSVVNSQPPTPNSQGGSANGLTPPIRNWALEPRGHAWSCRQWQVAVHHEERGSHRLAAAIGTVRTGQLFALDLSERPSCARTATWRTVGVSFEFALSAAYPEQRIDPRGPPGRSCEEAVPTPWAATESVPVTRQNGWATGNREDCVRGQLQGVADNCDHEEGRE